jgi:hypothetical protein
MKEMYDICMFLPSSFERPSASFSTARALPTQIIGYPFLPFADLAVLRPSSHQGFVLYHPLFASVQVGFKVYEPQGSFFIMADFTPFGFDDDVAFSRHLIEKVGVAAIPPSGFYT